MIASMLLAGERTAEAIYRAPWISALLLLVSIAAFSTSAWAKGSERYAVQAGSFKDANAALDLLVELRLDGFDCRSETLSGMTSVFCGDLDSSVDAERLRRSLLREGYKGAFLISSMNWSDPVSGSASKVFSLQVGSFSRRENAESVLDDLRSKGEQCWSRMINGLFKVYCGKFDRRKETARLRSRLAASGYAGAFAISLPSWPFFVSVPVPVIPPPVPAPPPIKVPLPPKAPPAPAKPLPVPDALMKGPPTTEPRPVPEQQPVIKKTRKGIDGSIFGRGGGHFHPFASITSY